MYHFKFVFTDGYVMETMKPVRSIKSQQGFIFGFDKDNKEGMCIAIVPVSRIKYVVMEQDDE